jgi:hypothetical protein
LHRGLFDPGPLTRGPEGPLARPRWTRSTWPAAGRGLLGMEAWEPAGSLRQRWRHEGGRRKRPSQTGSSPGSHRRGRRGRRRADGGVFRWWRGRVLQGNGGERRRFRTPWADSFGGETAGGMTEVHGKSAELGATSSGGGRRWPWRQLRLLYGRCTGERERE